MRHAAPSPHINCHCPACVAARIGVWRKLTAAQRRLLLVLHVRVPRHAADIFARDRVQITTIGALIFPRDFRPALVREIALGTRILTTPTTPFYLLTRHGADVVASVRHAERKAA